MKFLFAKHFTESSQNLILLNSQLLLDLVSLGARAMKPVTLRKWETLLHTLFILLILFNYCIGWYLYYMHFISLMGSIRIAYEMR